jgi:hypothetical protein
MIIQEDKKEQLRALFEEILMDLQTQEERYIYASKFTDIEGDMQLTDEKLSGYRVRLEELLT